MVMPNAYTSLAIVNIGGGSSNSDSSGGFITSGPVHLQVPAVLTDVKSVESMINARP
jgi:hypothetical protein